MNGLKHNSAPKLPDPNYLQALKKIWTDAGTWPEFAEAMRWSLVSDPGETAQNEWIQLPIMCCAAAGGDPGHAQTISLAWGLLYTAAHLMDSVADQDEVPAWMAKLGPGAMINIATGLYATSSLSLAEGLRGGIEVGVATRIEKEFNRTILQMCSGQHLDLKDTFQDLDTCWRVVQAKSGAIFELACTSGAQLATEDAGLISHYREYGKHLGIMVQIYDDASEIWGKRDGSQTKLNCYSIPIAYTIDVLSEKEREHFLIHMANSKENARSAAIVHSMVEHAGAAMYVQTKLQYHCQRAIDALKATGIMRPHYEKLAGYLPQVSLKGLNKKHPR
jgi:geranylgeranyl diphosphate synthase type I